MAQPAEALISSIGDIKNLSRDLVNFKEDIAVEIKNHETMNEIIKKIAEENSLLSDYGKKILYLIKLAEVDVTELYQLESKLKNFQDRIAQVDSINRGHLAEFEQLKRAHKRIGLDKRHFWKSGQKTPSNIDEKFYRAHYVKRQTAGGTTRLIETPMKGDIVTNELELLKLDNGKTLLAFGKEENDLLTILKTLLSELKTMGGLEADLENNARELNKVSVNVDGVLKRAQTNIIKLNETTGHLSTIISYVARINNRFKEAGDELNAKRV